MPPKKVDKKKEEEQQVKEFIDIDKKWIYYAAAIDTTNRQENNISSVCAKIAEAKNDKVKVVDRNELLEWAANQSIEKVSDEIKNYFAEKQKQLDVQNQKSAPTKGNAKAQASAATSEPALPPPPIPLPASATIAQALKHRIADLIRELHIKQREEKAKKEAEAAVNPTATTTSATSNPVSADLTANATATTEVVNVAPVPSDEQKIEPEIYIILKDFAFTLDDINTYFEQNVHLGACLVLERREKTEEEIERDKERLLQEQKQQQAKEAKGATAAKTTSTPANTKKSAQPTEEAKAQEQKQQTEHEKTAIPFSTTLRDQIDQLRRQNTPSRLRDLLFVDLRYPHDEPDDRIAQDIIYKLGICSEQLNVYRDWCKHNVFKELPNTTSAKSEVELAYYKKLNSTIPDMCATVPVILYCLVEQVVRNVEDDDTIQDDKKLEDPSDEMTNYLDTALSKLMIADPSTQQQQQLYASATTNQQVAPLRKLPPRSSVKLIHYGDHIGLQSINSVEVQDKITTRDIEMKMLRLLPIFPPAARHASEDSENIDDDSQKSGKEEEEEEQRLQQYFHRRSMIPEITSYEERGARLTEINHFIGNRLTPKQIEHQLLLARFEDLMMKNIKKILHNSSEKRPKQWNFSDRLYVEEFTKETLMQTLSKISLFDNGTTEAYTEYYDLENVALAAFHRRTPPARFETLTWYQDFPNRPHYNEWFRTNGAKALEVPNPLFEEDIDADAAEGSDDEREESVGLPSRPASPKHQATRNIFYIAGANNGIADDCIRFFPYDGPTVINLSSEYIEEQREKNITCSVHKDDAIFGFRTTLKPQRKTIRDDLKYDVYFTAAYEDYSCIFVSLVTPPQPKPKPKKKSKEVVPEIVATPPVAAPAPPVEPAKAEAHAKGKPASAVKSKPGNKKQEAPAPTPAPAPVPAEQPPQPPAPEPAQPIEEEAIEPPRKKIGRYTEVCYSCSNGLFVRQTSKGDIQQSFPSVAPINQQPQQQKDRRVPRKLTEQQLLQQQLMAPTMIEEPIDLYDVSEKKIYSLYSREVSRTISLEGTVTKNYENGCTKILYPNGNTTNQSPGGDVCLDVDRRGSRVVRYKKAPSPTPAPGVAVESQLSQQEQPLAAQPQPAQLHHEQPQPQQSAQEISEPATMESMDIPPCLYSENMDPETNTMVCTREDLVMLVEYDDGSVLVQHADGTRIWTEQQSARATAVQRITVEREGLATIVIVNLTTPEGDASVTSEIALPDRASIKFQQGSGFEIIRADGSRTSVLTKQMPGATAKDEPTERFFVYYEPKDLAFASKAHSLPEVSINKKPGVYIFDYENGGLRTVDFKGNIFMLSGAGRSRVLYPHQPLDDEKNADIPDMIDDNFEEAKEIATQIIEEREEEKERKAAEEAKRAEDGETNQNDLLDEDLDEEEPEEEVMDLETEMQTEAMQRLILQRTPPIKRGLYQVLTNQVTEAPPPYDDLHVTRLFVIKKDGSGAELLRHVDVAQFIERAKNDRDTSVTEEPVLGEQSHVVNLTFLTKIPPRKLGHEGGLRTDKIIPRTMLPRSGPKQQQQKQQHSVYNVMLLRKLTRYNPVTDEDRAHIRDSIKKWEDWIIQREAHSNNLISHDDRDDDEIAREHDIQQRIMEAFQAQHEEADLSPQSANHSQEESPTEPANNNNKLDVEDNDDNASNSSVVVNSDIEEEMYHNDQEDEEEYEEVLNRIANNNSRSASRTGYRVHTSNSMRTSPLENNNHQLQRPVFWNEEEGQKALLEIQNSQPAHEQHNDDQRKQRSRRPAIGQDAGNIGKMQLEQITNGGKYAHIRNISESGSSTTSKAPSSYKASNADDEHDEQHMGGISTEAAASCHNTNHHHPHDSNNHFTSTTNNINTKHGGQPASARISSSRGKQFDVYGNPRQEKVKVPVLARGQMTAASEKNEKYDMVENPVRRHVNTVSIKQKQLMTNSSSNGVATTTAAAKISPLGTMTSSMMMNSRLRSAPLEPLPSDYHDAPKIVVYPPQVQFGFLKEGGVYRSSIQLMNVGQIPGRFTIKMSGGTSTRQYTTGYESMFRLIYKKGPIAPGINVRVDVEIHALINAASNNADESPGQNPSSSPSSSYNVDEVLIVSTEGSIFNIPVTATVLSVMDYDQRFGGTANTNKRVQVVRMNLPTSLPSLQQRHQFQLPRPQYSSSSSRRASPVSASALQHPGDGFENNNVVMEGVVPAEEGEQQHQHDGGYEEYEEYIGDDEQQNHQQQQRILV